MTASKTNADACYIFSQIYEKCLWGSSPDPNSPHYSGAGSHQSMFVEPYVAGVVNYITSNYNNPDILDIGCGDFSIGSKIRPHCGRYVAGDIVESVISHNKNRFSDLGVEFCVLDAADSNLPHVDIVFVRQVFQHLSNDMIQSILLNLEGKCSSIIVTEHVPNNNKFIANLDMPTGSGIRLGRGSGVVVTSPPFSLPINEEEIICNVELDTSRVTTIAYKLDIHDNI